LDIFKIQKCPNSKFFDQSLVASFFEGKGTPYDFGIFLLVFQEASLSYDEEWERSVHM